jgi:hypothetical protein
MIKNKIVLSALAVLLLGVGACKKQLDINQNPNIASNVTPALLLPTAQVELASGLGVTMNNTGSFWVQYWTQNPSASQYRTLEQYQPVNSDFDRTWTTLYSGALTDLRKMNQQATRLNLKQYQAISMILTAYTFHIITDGWGDIPYSEALKGLTEEGAILNPKYDAQQNVYDSIINLTQAGMALISPSDANHPGKDDLIYNGDMGKWRRFANTLLLKMYLRMSYVNPGKAQAGVAAVYNNGIGFIGRGEDAQINFSSSSGNQNPLAQEVRRLGQNQVASATSADSLNSNNDPRRTSFYATTGNVIGLPQGATIGQPGVTYSVPGPVTGANAAGATTPAGLSSSSAPVILLASYESLFLQAEAVARNWDGGASADNDATLFEAAIIENFRIYATDVAGEVLRDSFPGQPISSTTTFIQTPEYAAVQYFGRDTLTGFIEGDSVSKVAGSYWGIYPATGTFEQRLRHIITQKWFSMNGTQGFEAWTEWRRTGYPNFLVRSQRAQVSGFPVRFIYPDVEFSRNAKFPGQRLVTDRVWWDVN